MQDWETMTEAAGGRFCHQCSRTVTDFTRMTDAALLTWLQQHGAGCGRFRATQLDREMVPPAVAAPGRWKRILLSIGLLAAVHKESSAQVQQPATGLRMEQLDVETPVLHAHATVSDSSVQAKTPFSAKSLNSWDHIMQGFVVRSPIETTWQPEATDRLKAGTVKTRLGRMLPAIGIRPVPLRRFFGFGKARIDCRVAPIDTKPPRLNQ